MSKIIMSELRTMWEIQGVWGEWRNLLNQDIGQDDSYFEFGLMPESKVGLDYRIVVNHNAIIWMQSQNSSFESEYIVQKTDKNFGSLEIQEKSKELKLHKFHVSNETYARFLVEADTIFQEYQDEERICFWSIPGHWFKDLSLIQFIKEQIVKEEYYSLRPSRNLDWYWP